MRLWHKDLIKVLPAWQLLGQWRECCAIMRNIKVKGTPNHMLVNKVMDYPINHFYTYTFEVYWELKRRGYSPDMKRFTKYIDEDDIHLVAGDIFQGWHNDKYLKQCFFNLQEKYDCGGITNDEWELIKSIQLRKENRLWL